MTKERKKKEKREKKERNKLKSEREEKIKGRGTQRSLVVQNFPFVDVYKALNATRGEGRKEGRKEGGVGKEVVRGFVRTEYENTLSLAYPLTTRSPKKTNHFHMTSQRQSQHREQERTQKEEPKKPSSSQRGNGTNNKKMSFRCSRNNPLFVSKGHLFFKFILNGFFI